MTRLTAETLGRVGVWSIWGRLDTPSVHAIEESGFGTLWLGGTPQASLEDVERFLEQTSTLTIATGIAAIWQLEPAAFASAYRRVRDRFGERFVLGLGTTHATSIGPHHASPYSAMTQYLDQIEAAGVPLDEVVIAALGPRMLGLAADRTAGAHTYLVSPAMTAEAREVMGSGALLIPEQRVALGEATSAEAIARDSIARPYLGLPNYLRNFRRSGFTDSDLAGEGSDRLIRALAAWGSPDAIRHRLHDQLSAGADHVCLQLLNAPGHNMAEGYRRLAAIAGLRSDPPRTLDDTSMKENA